MVREKCCDETASVVCGDCPRNPAAVPAFKVGDLVLLRSGGPMMTVDAEPRILTCQGNKHIGVQVIWFAGAELKRDTLLADELLRPA